MANVSLCPPLSRESVVRARKLIESHVHCTPVLTNKTLSQIASAPQTFDPHRGRALAKPVINLWFKCENMQRVGAFKARGAFHALERLKNEPGWLESGGRKKGVIGYSAGNHAQALALAAKENDIVSYVVMPSTARPNKIEATKGYGAKVIFSSSNFQDREAVAAKVIAETGARLVPPHDHPDIILGQATVGLEMQEQVKELDAIIAPCSGGGLLAGIALSCEGTGIKVFGAEPELEGADDGRRSFYSGTRIKNVQTRTIADGLVGTISALPWNIIYERKLVSGMYAVSEQEIKEATKLIFERLKIWVEPSAAVPLAVALFNEDFRSMVEREAGDKGWN
ncbi:threonine dehydratase catabolic, partial [Corynespora cassiicola Philippines]